jgi:hemoglobin
MKTVRMLVLSLALPGCVAGAALAQQAYAPGPHNIAYPADYPALFIRYATVDKPDRKIIRHLYASPQAFAAARPGEPLPPGTILIMEDHPARLGSDQNPLLDQQGRFIAEPRITSIFVQEKRAGWGAGYPETIRNGEWEYARFNPDGSRHSGALESCFACHLKARPAQDFAFNFWDYVQMRK